MKNKAGRNNKYSKKSNTRTRRIIIITALLCFLAGYAARSAVVSYENFKNSIQQKVVQQNFASQQSTTLPSASTGTDGELIKKVAADPDDLQSWIQLGNLYFDSGQNEKAISAYKRALDLDPRNPDVETDLGIVDRRTDQFALAIKSFNKAREINPTHKNSAYNKGFVLYHDMGNIAEALKVWKELVKEDPDFLMPNGRKLSDFLKTIE